MTSPTRGLTRGPALSAAARWGQRGFVFRKGWFHVIVICEQMLVIPDIIVEGGGGSDSRPRSWDCFCCDRGRADVRVSKLCDNSITCHDFVTNSSLGLRR